MSSNDSVKAFAADDRRAFLMLRVLRALAVLAASVGAFLGTCLIFDAIFPERELPWSIQERTNFLKARDGKYDALFLGSSRVGDNIVPATFDRELAEHGFAIQSFNAGVSGMHPPQDACLLDLILELKLKRIRWVFVELQTLELKQAGSDVQTLQQLYWHDWPRFRLLCDALLAPRERDHWRMRVTLDRWPDFYSHTLLFARRFVSLGRGAALLNRWVSSEAEEPARQWDPGLEERDGWQPAGVKRVRKEKEIAALEDILKKRRKSPPVREFGDSATLKALDLMVAKIQSAGATPILFVPPTARETYFFPDPARTPHLVILNFCNLEKYPELYETKNRLDTSHLNPDGAQIFTRLLADRFAELPAIREAFSTAPP